MTGSVGTLLVVNFQLMGKGNLGQVASLGHDLSIEYTLSVVSLVSLDHMATAHCGLKLDRGVPAKTECLVTKRKTEKMDSGDCLFLAQSRSFLGWGRAL